MSYLWCSASALHAVRLRNDLSTQQRTKKIDGGLCWPVISWRFSVPSFRILWVSSFRKIDKHVVSLMLLSSLRNWVVLLGLTNFTSLHKLFQSIPVSSFHASTESNCTNSSWILTFEVWILVSMSRLQTGFWKPKKANEIQSFCFRRASFKCSRDWLEMFLFSGMREMINILLISFSLSVL